MPPLPPFPHYISAPVAHSSQSQQSSSRLPSAGPSTQQAEQAQAEQAYTLPPIGTSRRGSRTPSLDSVNPVDAADFDVPGPSRPVLARHIDRPDAVLVRAPGRREDVNISALDDAQDVGEEETAESGSDVDDGALPESPPPAGGALRGEAFEPLYPSPDADVERAKLERQQELGLALDPGSTSGLAGGGGGLAPGPASGSGHSAEGTHTPPPASSTMSTIETRVDPAPDPRPSLPHLAASLPTITGPSHFRPMTPTTPRPRPGGGRFRASAQKVLQMHQTRAALLIPGAEQGADLRRDSAELHWGHVKQECAIEVCDYSSTNAAFTRLSNRGLAHFLEGKGKDRPGWAKVRWINVGGISWDVVRAVAVRYDLHPLAAEDVLRCGETGSRSKSDYYRGHLFLTMVAHYLARDEQEEGEGLPSYEESEGAVRGGGVVIESPVDMRAEEGEGSARAGLRERRSSVWARAKDTVSAAAAFGAGTGVGLRRTTSRDDIESTLEGLQAPPVGPLSGEGADAPDPADLPELDDGGEGERRGREATLVPDVGVRQGRSLAGENLEFLGERPSLGDRLGRRKSSRSPSPHSRSHSHAHSALGLHTPHPPADVERDAPSAQAEQERVKAKEKQWASWMSLTPVKRRKAFT